MLATPVRWFLMLLVAACGYFMITSQSMYTRAFAFTGSVVCWQFYYVVMMWEADVIRNSGGHKKQQSGGAEPVAAGKQALPEASV